MDDKSQTLDSNFRRNLRPNLFFGNGNINGSSNKFNQNGNYLQTTTNTMPKVFKSSNRFLENSNQRMNIGHLNILSQPTTLSSNLFRYKFCFLFKN